MPNYSDSLKDHDDYHDVCDNPEKYFKRCNHDKTMIKISPCVHRGEKRLQLRFPYDTELLEKVKKIPDCRWSATMHCWHVPDNDISKKYLTALPDVLTTTFDSEIFFHHQKNSEDSVVLEIDEFNQQIFIKFRYNEDIKNEIKKLDGAWWHKGIKQWTVDYSKENLEKLSELFNIGNKTTILRKKKPDNIRKPYARSIKNHEKVPEKFIKELKLLNKSPNTIKLYGSAIAGFIDHFKEKDIEHISTSEIHDYILKYRDELNYSPSFQNQQVSALKLFYRIMFQKEFNNEELPRPKKARRLPRVLSKEDVIALLKATRNEKHRLILMIMYGCGLRLGEIINLKIEDIDFNRNQICIYNGKGRKDRHINLSRRLAEMINAYIRDYAPYKYLFNGQGGIKYSRESVVQVVKKAAMRAGIRKRVSPHILRHCYATHMLEKGVDLRYIQYLMGHKSSKTTEIYTHVSNYRLNDLGSPIDDIEL